MPVLPNAAANIPLPTITLLYISLQERHFFFCNSAYLNFSSASEQDGCQIAKQFRKQRGSYVLLLKTPNPEENSVS